MDGSSASSQPNHSYSGETPLHIAARSDNANSVFVLVGSLHCNVTARDLNGDTVIHAAVASNCLSAAKCLASNLPPETLALLDSENVLEMTPLYLACSIGYVKMEILAKVSDLASVCTVSTTGARAGRKLARSSSSVEISMSGMTTTVSSDKAHPTLVQPALLAAVLNDNLECALTLLDAGADVNQTDKAGHTAISLSAKRGYFQMCQILLSHGANLTIRSRKGVERQSRRQENIVTTR